MSLMRYQPWSMFDQLHRDINRVFDKQSSQLTEPNTELFGKAWMPAIDIKDEEKHIVLFADVPGIDVKDIHVDAHNGVLTIKGERKFEKETTEKDFHRIERSYGSFFRQFALPDNVADDDISAKCKDGVLEVRIPKKAPSQAKRIPVHS